VSVTVNANEEVLSHIFGMPSNYIFYIA